VAGAGGSATRGVWRTTRDGRSYIVKRLEPFSARSLDVRHHSWWRREAEVARSKMLSRSLGLRPPEPITLEEDEGGITLWSPELAVMAIDDRVVANAYGRFNSQTVQDPGWFTLDMLRDRISTTESIGGLRPLRESDLVDASLLRASEALWSRRASILDELDSLPRVLSHGDALPRNLICHDGNDVIAVDWGQLGYNTIGADLATFCLYCTEDLADLLSAYCEGLRQGGQSLAKTTVRRAVVGIAALIAVSRASRAVAAGQSPAAYLGRLGRAQCLIDEVVTRT
jgi:hypothetical protein